MLAQDGCGRSRFPKEAGNAPAVGQINVAMEITRRILDDFNFTNNSHETND